MFLILTLGSLYTILYQNVSASVDEIVSRTIEINNLTANGPVLNDYDYFGRSIANIGDLNGDDVLDIAVGAYYDDAGGFNKGAIHVMLMNSNGTVSSTIEINDLTEKGPVLDNNDNFGRSIANIGDLNGDGVLDIAVGAYYDDADGFNKGAIHVMLMNSNGTVSSTIEINDLTEHGPELISLDYFGYSIANIGDLNKDGTLDIAVGAPGDDAGGDYRGAIHVMLMNSNGTVSRTIEINDGTANGPELINDDYFGRSIANIGDLNKDGTLDIAVGAPGDDAGGSNRGAIHVMLMNSDGTVSRTIEINNNTANGPELNNDNNLFGSSIANIGDLNGNGVDDIVVGAFNDNTGGSNRGAIHVMLMNSNGTVSRTIEINDDTANGPELNDYDGFGYSIANIGDLNGDGVDDIAVGASGDDAGGDSRGAIHVMLMDNTDLIPSNITAITSNVTSSATLKVGDTILFTLILGSSENVTVSGTYNAVALNWTSIDSGATYTATYTISEGDADQITPLQITQVTITNNLNFTDLSFNGTDIQQTIDANSPVITLNGSNLQTVVQGAGYAELGATTSDDSTITINSANFTDIVGTYYIYYDSTDTAGNNAIQVIRTVIVVDTTPPTFSSAALNEGTGIFTITFNEIINASSINSAGFSIRDNNTSTGTITLSNPELTTTANGDTISFNMTLANRLSVIAFNVSVLDIGAGAVQDINGNAITMSANNTITTTLDSIPPVISLIGDNPQTIEQGAVYTELNATTNDGSPVTINSANFTDAVGTYYIYYDSTDTAGNNAIQVIRTVIVPDTTPPTFSSAVLNEGTGTFTITFNEIINASSINSAGFSIRDNNTSTGAVTLSTLELTTTANGDTISFNMTLANRQSVIAFNVSVLDIGAGAVRDISGNTIIMSTGNPITTTLDTIPPALTFTSITPNNGTLGIGDDIVIQINANNETGLTLLSGTINNETMTLSETTPTSSFGYRKTITINNTMVSGSAEHTNFPLLVSIQHDPNLNNATVQASGQDIRFTTINDTPLYYEITSFSNNHISGNLSAWIMIPTLYASNDTKIYMYYSNSIVTDGQNATAVWDSDYDGVWHFDGDMLDSTSNDNDGTNFNSTGTTGIIGGARSFDGNDYISYSDSEFPSGNNSRTLSAWVNHSSLQVGFHGVLVYGTGATSQAYGLFQNSNNLIVGGYSDDIALNTTATTNDWYHFAMTYDGTTVRTYIDGSPDANGTKSWSTVLNEFRVGQQVNDFNEFFSGQIDEIRISDTVRTADWIKTEYNNQNSGSFYSVSAPEKLVLSFYYDLTYTVAEGDTDIDDATEGIAYNITLVDTVGNPSTLAATIPSISSPGVDANSPVITLNGSNLQIIEQGAGYTELNATTNDGSTITINSANFTDLVGTYYIYYDSTDTAGNNAIQVNRTVIVSDTTPPVITLNGTNPQTIELGDGYTEQNATANDGSTITINSTNFADAVGNYTIYYDSTDTAGNTAIQVNRTVNVVDTTPPVITLNGTNPQTIELGDGYTEQNATTNDGSTITINSTNFADAVGNYTIYYDSTDTAGNNAIQVNRTVNVVDTTPPVISLIGDNPQTREQGAGYTELNATTNDGSPVTINSTNFADAVGTYYIYYDSTDTAGNNAIQVNRTVIVSDTTPPTFSSAVLNEGTGIFTITFNEIINASSINSTGFSIRDNNTSTGTITLSNPELTTTANGDTISFNMTLANRLSVIAFNVSVLDIGAGAVQDINGNAITMSANNTITTTLDSIPPVISLIGDNPQTREQGAGYTELNATTNDGSPVTINSANFTDAVGTYYIYYDSTDTAGNNAIQVIRTVIVSDTTPPTFSSAVLNEGTGIFTITFNEIINASSINSAGFSIRDNNTSTGAVTLSTLELTTTANGDTISFNMTLANRQSVIAFNVSVLDIGAGAVRDISGNTIIMSTDNSITTTLDTIPPTLTFTSITPNNGTLGIGDDIVIQINANNETGLTLLSGTINNETMTLSETTPTSSFGYRKTITINNTMVSGSAEHTNFPLLVSIQHDPNLNNATVQASGQDIRFTTINDTPLYYEITSFSNNHISGSLSAWIMIPTLYASNDTKIYMYYSNSIVTDGQNATAVWDSDYDGVWHFDGDMLDSTSNNNDGTNFNSTGTTGIIGGARSFDGNDYISYSDSEFPSGNNSRTLSAWVNHSSLPSDYHGVLVYGTGSTGQAYGLFQNSNNLIVGGYSDDIALNTTLTTNDWYHFAMTYDGATVRTYIDGSPDTNGTKSWNTVLNEFRVGQQVNDFNQFFTGQIDEIRISDTVRTADWIKTEYNNQNSGSFYSVSAPEKLVMLFYYDLTYTVAEGDTDIDDATTGIAYNITLVDTVGNPSTLAATIPSISSPGVDANSPVITLNGSNPQIIEQGAGYTELGATTSDGSTITINSANFTDLVGTYHIYYDSTDTAGNNAIQVNRTVNVVDTTAPIITLNGTNPQTIEQGAGYTELGATTNDGSTITINSANFTDLVGTYHIYYDSTDAFNNTAIQVNRTVNVVDSTLPVFSSAVLNEGTGIFTIAFNKTVNVSTINSTGLSIRDNNTSIDAVTLSTLELITTANGTTISFNMTLVNRQSVIAFTTSVLDIGAGAVQDIYGNQIVATTGNPIATTSDTIPPVISLLGNNPQTIEQGAGYTELGATTNDNSTITINSANFTDTLGTYTIYYDSADISGNNAIQVNRTVIVSDTTPPVITLNGANPQTIELGDDYTELGATTNDGSTITINSTNFTDILGTYTIYYDSVDASGNNAIQVNRTVIVSDTTPPVITLNGANPQTIELGDDYTELGATTNDGSTITINSTNFTDILGTYTIYYDSVDASGNNAIQVNRTVIVSDTTPSDPCVIPDSGDWIITNSCTLDANADAPESVIVQNGSVLNIPSGITLDIDFTTFNLTVQSGGGVLIKSGGTLT